MLHFTGENQLQVLQYQYGGKGMPLGSHSLGINPERKLLVEFLQDLPLVGPGQRTEHAPDTDIGRQ